MVTVLPDILWVVFALVVLLLFKKDLHALLINVIWRVKAGASIKIASFEIGPSYVSPKTGASKGGIYEIKDDENYIRYKERKAYYESSRRLFLVHRLSSSKNANQLYDIRIYLIPHRDASLSGVKKVEYYFGRHWKNKIFTSIDRSNGFPIETSAFGPFLCTAKIHFTDGNATMIWRYIDFESGAIGNEYLGEDKKEGKDKREEETEEYETERE